MKKNLSKKQMQILMFVCIGIITLGIGYAAISNIILTINGTGTATVDPNNFNVHFDTTVSPTMTANKGSATIDSNDNKVAHINATGLTKAGDYATAEYTVINEPNGIGAQISLDLVCTNTEYFRVTQTIDDVELQSGDTTQVRVVVELIKTPIEDTVTTEITGTIEAVAIEDANATSSASSSVVGTNNNNGGGEQEDTYAYLTYTGSNVDGPSIGGDASSLSTSEPTDKNYYLKYKLDGDNLVTNSYACVKFAGTEYCLEGGPNDTYGWDTDAAHSTGRVQALYEIQQASISGVSCYFYSTNSSCDGSVMLQANTYGIVYVYKGGESCYVDGVGSSRCRGGE